MVFFTLYNIEGVTSFPSERPILCAYIDVVLIQLQVKALAYFASIVHIVMISRFTALMRVVCRYSHSRGLV
jgi:hypothetical protein